MKKITFIIALFCISSFSNAQVLLSEGFDTALNWTVTHVSGSAGSVGWTRVTTGANPACTPAVGAGMAQFDAYNIASGNNYSLRSPEITFTGASYRVTFKMFRDNGYPDDADRIRVYYNNTTANGGTLLGTVNRSIALAPVVAATGWYNYSFDLPAGLNNTGYVAFMATSAYGNRIFMDDIKVSQIQNDDAQMVSINMQDISATQGNTNIAGTLKNMGANTMTSVDLNYQVNGGTVYTQNLTGLSIAPGATYNYSHTTPWNATPGQYTIKVFTSNPNGNSDTDMTNDEVTKVVAIASGSSTRLPLYEKFSSSTCPPCATFNGNYFNGFLSANHDDFALISYQVNWPGTGDPYYTAEVGSRVGFYGVNAAPTLFVDATDDTPFSTSGLNNTLAAELLKPSFFSINATHNLVGNDITVNIDVVPYLTGSYTVHAVVTEKTTYDNATSNGETEFHNVAMKMVPNAAGTVMNFVHDVPQSLQVQANLSGLNIEEIGDIEVVVFVQNNVNKAIMQTTYAPFTLGANQFASTSAIKMFPNPTSGIVRVSSKTPVNVVISDITGKIILSADQVTEDTPLNISAFQKGIYMAKITNGEAQQTQKIILK